MISIVNAQTNHLTRIVGDLVEVTLVADGGENLSVEWEFELRMANDGRWLIWSVRELADG